jgi:diketogulonate reductase-like aldo/keto reductase
VAIAEEIGCTPAQVALNWVRSQSALIIPIVGARTEEQMKQNVGCLDVTLSEEHLKRLDDISRIPLGFPHEFMQRDFFKDILYAGMYDQIDNHRAGGRQ